MPRHWSWWLWIKVNWRWFWLLKWSIRPCPVLQTTSRFPSSRFKLINWGFRVFRISSEEKLETKNIIRLKRHKLICRSNSRLWTNKRREPFTSWHQSSICYHLMHSNTNIAESYRFLVIDHTHSNFIEHANQRYF